MKKEFTTKSLSKGYRKAILSGKDEKRIPIRKEGEEIGEVIISNKTTKFALDVTDLGKTFGIMRKAKDFDIDASGFKVNVPPKYAREVWNVDEAKNIVNETGIFGRGRIKGVNKIGGEIKVVLALDYNDEVWSYIGKNYGSEIIVGLALVQLKIFEEETEDEK